MFVFNQVNFYLIILKINLYYILDQSMGHIGPRKHILEGL